MGHTRRSGRAKGRQVAGILSRPDSAKVVKISISLAEVNFTRAEKKGSSVSAIIDALVGDLFDELDQN